MPQLTINTEEPVLRPVSMNVFPTMGSLQEVIDFAESRLPINSKNEVTTLLFIYHNTLLSQVNACKP